MRNLTDAFDGVIRCPSDMPAAVVAMLTDTIESAWRDFTPPADAAQVPEAFWAFLTDVTTPPPAS